MGSSSSTGLYSISSSCELVKRRKDKEVKVVNIKLGEAGGVFKLSENG